MHESAWRASPTLARRRLISSVSPPWSARSAAQQRRAPHEQTGDWAVDLARPRPRQHDAQGQHVEPARTFRYAVRLSSSSRRSTSSSWVQLATIRLTSLAHDRRRRLPGRLVRRSSKSERQQSPQCVDHQGLALPIQNETDIAVEQERRRDADDGDEPPDLVVDSERLETDVVRPERQRAVELPLQAGAGLSCEHQVLAVIKPDFEDEDAHQPERSFEMYITPHTESAMAMFGFVYLDGIEGHHSGERLG